MATQLYSVPTDPFPSGTNPICEGHTLINGESRITIFGSELGVRPASPTAPPPVPKEAHRPSIAEGMGNGTAPWSPVHSPGDIEGHWETFESRLVADWVNDRPTAVSVLLVKHSLRSISGLNYFGLNTL